MKKIASWRSHKLIYGVSLVSLTIFLVLVPIVTTTHTDVSNYLLLESPQGTSTYDSNILAIEGLIIKTPFTPPRVQGLASIGDEVWEFTGYSELKNSLLLNFGYPSQSVVSVLIVKTMDRDLYFVYFSRLINNRDETVFYKATPIK